MGYGVLSGPVCGGGISATTQGVSRPSLGRELGLFNMIPREYQRAPVTSLAVPLEGAASLVTLVPRLKLSSLRLMVYKTRVIIFLRQKLP